MGSQPAAGRLGREARKEKEVERYAIFKKYVLTAVTLALSPALLYSIQVTPEQAHTIIQQQQQLLQAIAAMTAAPAEKKTPNDCRPSNHALTVWKRRYGPSGHFSRPPRLARGRTHFRHYSPDFLTEPN